VLQAVSVDSFSSHDTHRFRYMTKAANIQFTRVEFRLTSAAVLSFDLAVEARGSPLGGRLSLLFRE
jgi:hypothetical protein